MINFMFINSRLINQIKSVCSRVHNPRKSIVRYCAVRRAMLYVPGNDQRKIDKALSFRVDCIAFDCEDGVAENKKDEARMLIKQMLDEGNVTKTDPEWCVRINSVDTGDICLSDINAILSAKKLPPTIALPKVESCDHLQWFAEQVWKKLIERPEDDRGPVNLIMFIESARAIMLLPELCQKAQDLSTMTPIIPAALVFGSDDLLASIGATRTTHGIELLYARQKLVLIAKAFGLQAIDMVNINLKALEELQRESKEGALMGYTGKQVIHPSQIGIVQEEFSPSRSKVKWAKSIIKEFKKNQEKGMGAFTFEEKMIDMPTVRQAKNIINAAKLSGKIKDEEMEKDIPPE